MPIRRLSRAFAEDFFCVAILFAVVFAATLPLFSNDAIPLAVEGIFAFAPWEAERPAEFQPTESHELANHLYRYYPWYRFLNEAAHSGQSLLWNPAEALGTPFFAQWRTRVLSPFSVPFYLFSLNSAFQIAFALKILAAMLCAYGAARRFYYPPAVALIPALAWGLSPLFLLWNAAPLADAAVWLPLLFVVTERAATGAPRAATGLALVLTLIGLGGEPPLLAIALCFALIYLLARLLLDREKTGIKAGLQGILLGAIMAAMLLAIHLVPYIEYLGQAVARRLASPALSWRDLAAVIAPSLLDRAQSRAPMTALLLHPGLIPLLLLGLWVALRRFVGISLRAPVESLLFAAALLPLVAALAQLFGADLGLQHGFVLLPFALGMMAATAAETWIRLNAAEAKAALRNIAWSIPAIWGPALLLAGIAGRGGLGGWGQFALVVLLFFALFALYFVTLLKPNERLAGYGTATLTAASLLLFCLPLVPATPAPRVFPETAFIQSLKQTQTRIAGSAALRQWPLSAHGIPTVFSPAGDELLRHRAFIEASTREPLLMRRTGAQTLLLTKEDIRGAFAPVRNALRIAEVYPSGAVLFRDTAAIPRARMIYAGRRSDHYSPDQLDADLPPLLEGATLPEKENGARAAATIAQGERNTQVAVNVANTPPGILVLADTWYPGWTATVDGHPAPVLPVDAVFRGVELGEGTHTVQFDFDPISHKAGRWISLAALLLWIIPLLPLQRLPRRSARRA